jgi:integrase
MGSGRRITKDVVDRLQPGETVWCIAPRGFGVRRQQRDAVYVIKARVDGRQRFITIGTHGKPWTPETARRRAIELFGLVAGGGDPAGDRDSAKMVLTLESFAERYLREHARPKKKPSSAADDERNLRNHIKPALGRLRLTDITRSDVVKLHAGMQDKPVAANRCLALLSHMFRLAEEWSLVPEYFNPCRRVTRYREVPKERFLTTHELQRLGNALREAETIGIPWEVDEGKRGAKHLARPENRRTIISPYATGAIRLLLLTGARLREILGLRWEWIDFERKLIFLPDSKTGKKTIVLNAPAIAELNKLARIGTYVIAGNDPERPRVDIKRPWSVIAKRAELTGVRLHDLRHSFASAGVGMGLGLPIIGKLLGHTQVQTTHRYAHLELDPIRRGAEFIGIQLAAGLGEVAWDAGVSDPHAKVREDTSYGGGF